MELPLPYYYLCLTMHCCHDLTDRYEPELDTIYEDEELELSSSEEDDNYTYYEEEEETDVNDSICEYPLSFRKCVVMMSNHRH